MTHPILIRQTMIDIFPHTLRKHILSFSIHYPQQHSHMQYKLFNSLLCNTVKMLIQKPCDCLTNCKEFLSMACETFIKTHKIVVMAFCSAQSVFGKGVVAFGVAQSIFSVLRNKIQYVYTNPFFYGLSLQKKIFKSSDEICWNQNNGSQSRVIKLVPRKYTKQTTSFAHSLDASS